MTKPTRLKLLAQAIAISATVTMISAAVLATAAGDEFQSLRSTVGQSLSGFYVFWCAFFACILLVVWLFNLGYHYNVSTRSERILSKDGVLLFDREQHIAISVPTMKAILLSLAEEAEQERAFGLLYRTGQLAGERFGGAFRGIYVGQIQPNGAKSWDELNDNEKLDAWERYDSTAGWGQLNAQKYESRAYVDVTFRHPSLFEGRGGELFSWLLAGYSQEIVAAIIGRTVRFNPKESFTRDTGILSLRYTY